MINSKNNTKQKESPTKESKFFEQYYDLFSFRTKPINQMYLERLAHEEREWSLKDTSLRFGDFLAEKGIRFADYYRWHDRCEALKASHEFLMERIASRREIGALTRQFDAPTVHRSLAKYCSVAKEMAIFHASLTKEDKNKEEIVRVFVDTIPDSPLVPEKK